MKIDTVSHSFGKFPAGKIGALPKKAPITYENPIKVADVLPASGVLGAGLMAAYFIKGGKLNKFIHNRSLQEIAKKSDILLGNYKNHELYVNKEIKPLRKGFTKVLYSGQKEDRSLKHIMVFDKHGDIVKQVRSFEKVKLSDGSPVGYNRRIEILDGQKHKSFVETNFNLEKKPLNMTIIKGGEKQQIVFETV